MDASKTYYRNQLMALVEKSNVLIDNGKYDEAFNQRDEDDMIAENLGKELKPPARTYF